MKDYADFDKVTNQIASILVENEATISNMYLIAKEVNARLQVVGTEVRNAKRNYLFGIRTHDD